MVWNFLFQSMFGQRYDFLMIQSWSHKEVLCGKAESGLWFLVPQFVPCTEVQVEVEIELAPITPAGPCQSVECVLLFNLQNNALVDSDAAE